MGFGNGLTIFEKLTQLYMPAPKFNEIVATVNSQKINFAFSRKDEPFSNSGNHEILVLISVLGKKIYHLLWDHFSVQRHQFCVIHRITFYHLVLSH